MRRSNLTVIYGTGKEWTLERSKFSDQWKSEIGILVEDVTSGFDTELFVAFSTDNENLSEKNLKKEALKFLKQLP